MSRLSYHVSLLTLLLAGCRTAVVPLGSSLEVAKRNADNALAAFAYRFYNVQRDPRFAAARPRLARYALIPSGVFNDTSVWTERDRDSVRVLHVHGGISNRGYLFSARPATPYPQALGDERHFMQLASLGNGSYEWITQVDHGIGPVRASEVAAALGVLLTAFEGRPGPVLRRETRDGLPRTTRHLSQLFALDSLASTPLPDGSTRLAMHVSITPDSLRPRLPALAAYLDKYVMPSRARMQLHDHAGAAYVDLRLRDGRFEARLRAARGSLVPLTGPAPFRPLPDSLRMRLDFSARFRLFRVGFTNMVGDFTIERGEHERAWMMRFRREPDWDFPLATDRLIRSPLRRPFEGRGSELRLAVRDDLGSQAMSVRRIRTAVRESAIMRWLGGLGSAAYDDFAGRSEAEENRYLMELFSALRQDVAALVP